MAIVWVMAGEAGPALAFTLEHEVQPQDVRELLAASPRVKAKLTIAVVVVMLCGLVAVGFTAITIALNYRSAVFSAAGAPGGIYVADLALWLVTAFLAWAAWQRSPGRLAQVVIEKTPEFQGRTRDQVETSGIRAISATGTEVFYPWATIDQVRETTRAFHLLDHDGRILAILPKRALDSPDLLPALRTFLKQALEQQPAAATASTAADESQP
jgi:YcxB-like protein